MNECTLGADIDAKVDAITKLQAEFEAGCEVRPPPSPFSPERDTC